MDDKKVRSSTELQEFLTANKKTSLFRKYQELTVGKKGLLPLIRYEVITSLFSGCPGAFGYFFRKTFFQLLFNCTGRGTVFGKDIILRHPSKISIGERVIIDDSVVLDAKGRSNRGLKIGNNVILSRNTILSCKEGDIEIDDNTNIGQNCLIHSETSVRLGKNVLMAAFCYIVAGGNHSYDRTDIPIIQQPSYSKGGIVIEDNVWLGANVTVLDGVKIGRDSIIGAGAVVIDDIPEFSIAVGVPAKVIKSRR